MKTDPKETEGPVLPLPKPKLTITQSVEESGLESALKTAEPQPEVGVKCIYCAGSEVVKRGKRKKKFEIVQLYFCHSCRKTFVWQKVKGKQFPLRIILEGLSLWHIGHSLDESCRRLKEQFGLEVKASTLGDWVKEFEPLCRYGRLRPFGLKLYGPQQVIQTVHLFHRQVYDFSVHRAKLALLLQDFRHARLGNLREFLEAIQAECPHQFFREGVRSSELKVDFDLGQVVVRTKQNFATRLAGLVLPAVSDNKLRHKTLQQFMLANDSVTVAAEVPVLITPDDIHHLRHELNFVVPIEHNGKVITGEFFIKAE